MGAVKRKLAQIHCLSMSSRRYFHEGTDISVIFFQFLRQSHMMFDRMKLISD